ncbi:MAG: VCBS repeat-containing protein, partial [Maribacter sp.]
ISMAPKNISNTSKVPNKINKLTQFDTELEKINEKYPAGGIVNLSFDKSNHKLLIGDYYGQLHEWNNPKVKWSIKSPLISSIQNAKDLYITGIGIMTPSEVSAGAIYRADTDKITPIVKDLHRPVYVEINDLNENGNKEIIICEFGHLTGELSIHVEQGKILNKKTLLALPGSICVEIIDMNGDGRKDIVALFSQGREGIYIFYQKENFEFSMEHSIKMGPEYGSSWFSIIDFNKDGYNDIVLTNGDNADYSKFLKPYHGIRLFINDGKNNFQEKWFYPINGATKVLVEDFDLDGDLDFAVSSFFPDALNHPEKGFIYLENINSSEFVFNTQVSEMAKNGKWLVMEKGDFDQDGDVDIMLGNFNKIKSNAFKTLKNYDLLYLENKQISK